MVKFDDPSYTVLVMDKQQTGEKRDPLLSALLMMAKLKQRPISRKSLLSKLPYQNKMFGAGLFIQGAEKIGLSAYFRARKFSELTEALFPIVILVENNDTLIITEMTEDGCYKVLDPITTESLKLSHEDLEKRYDGYCFIIKKLEESDAKVASLDMDVKPSHWFWREFLRYKMNYSIILFASLFVNLFAVAMPLFIMNVYDRVVPNNAMETLWVLTSGVCIVILFDFILKTMRVYFVDLSGEKVDVLVSQKIFQHLLGMTMEAKEESTGIAAHRVQQFENIASFITSSTIITLIDIPFILLFLLIVYLVGGNLVWISLVAIPIMVILAFVISFPLRRAVKQSYQHSALKQGLLVESIKNFDMIKSLGIEGALAGRWERYAALAAKAGVKSRYLQFTIGNLVGTIQLVVTVLVIVSGVFLIQEGLLTMGALIACTILTTRALAPLSGLLNLALRYQMAKVSLMTLNKLMMQPLETSIHTKKISREILEPRVEFNKVTFAYPGTALPIFDRISFRVNSHERVGIIGPMGGGKSTLLKLIMGFYPSTEGTIMVGGIDIQQLDTADLRANIAYSEQQDHLLCGTLRDNLTVGMPWIDDKAIIDAVNLVGANSFLDNHPQGYDLHVGEDGANLSGGQKQAITLVRTFLKDSELLLLDEPTSAMDVASESVFINNMKKYLTDKTLILVTHRTTLLPLVDRLIVVKDGMIIADGSRDAIIQALIDQDKK